MVGLASLLALVLAVTTWVWLRDEEYVAPTGSPGAAVRPAEASVVLQLLTDALTAGDADAAAALAPPGDAVAVRTLRSVATTAGRIPIADLSLRYLSELGGVDDSGAWPAAVEMTWRYADADRAPSAAEIEVRFEGATGEVSVADLGGPHGRTPVWLTGAVEVRRSPQVVVVAADDAGRYHRLARRAVRTVRRVVAGWTTPLVIEVPAEARGVDRALGAEPGSYATVAGVTAPPGGEASAEASTSHVFLNPDRISSLTPQGAQVVVSHEAAHVALGADSASLPLWLVEGFADYVALRGVDLPLTVTAAQVIREVRQDGPPRQLPDEDEFDQQSEHFGAAYEAAWLACRLLVGRAGERRVLGFYRRAEGVSDFAGLFRRTFGLSQRAFTGEWRRALSDLAA